MEWSLASHTYIKALKIQFMAVSFVLIVYKLRITFIKHCIHFIHLHNSQINMSLPVQMRQKIDAIIIVALIQIERDSKTIKYIKLIQVGIFWNRFVRSG